MGYYILHKVGVITCPCRSTLLVKYFFGRFDQQPTIQNIKHEWCLSYSGCTKLNTPNWINPFSQKYTYFVNENHHFDHNTEQHIYIWLMHMSVDRWLTGDQTLTRFYETSVNTVIGDVLTNRIQFYGWKLRFKKSLRLFLCAMGLRWVSQDQLITLLMTKTQANSKAYTFTDIRVPKYSWSYRGRAAKTVRFVVPRL